jgi:hypothetical protein
MMSWWTSDRIKNANKELNLEDYHKIVIKIRDLSLDEILGSIKDLKDRLEDWKGYYEEYDEVLIDDSYNSYADEKNQYFLSGVRNETDDERTKRITDFREGERQQAVDLAKKESVQLQKKKEQYEKLKKELGEK